MQLILSYILMPHIHDIIISTYSQCKNIDEIFHNIIQTNSSNSGVFNTNQIRDPGWFLCIPGGSWRAILLLPTWNQICMNLPCIEQFQELTRY